MIWWLLDFSGSIYFLKSKDTKGISLIIDMT